MQKGMRAVADSPKPSIAAVQRHCIGGALDLIAACDIRYAAADAIFSLREVKVAIVADMGSLQRLPYLIGEGPTRELALTGRDVNAEEALRMNLITKILPDKDAAYAAALETAREMSENSALVMRGVKYIMNKQRGLDADRALRKSDKSGSYPPTAGPDVPVVEQFPLAALFSCFGWSTDAPSSREIL